MQRQILEGLLACFIVLVGTSRAQGPSVESPAPVYELVKNYTGQGFFDSFDFFSGTDLSSGFVQYQDLESANATGLAGFAESDDWEDVIYLGVDYQNITLGGRPATRLEGRDLFNHSLWVADIKHMPGGICGVWPAYWLLGEGEAWPAAGEIDIIEGINEQTNNLMVLHTNNAVSVANLTTTPGSTSAAKRDTQNQMTGTFTSLDCNPGVGCVVSSSWNSYGPGYNAEGGGVVVTEFTGEAIKIWNFPRNSIPQDLIDGNPDPTAAVNGSLSWGAPEASFVNDNASTSFDDHFFNLKIIFNIDFCGPWLDPLWNSSGCASLAPTCEQYVANHPSAFEDAYWAIGGVQIYQPVSSNSSSTPAETNSTSASVERTAPRRHLRDIKPY
jgi:hypothetical protein